MPPQFAHYIYAAVQSPLLVVLAGFLAYHFGIARSPLRTRWAKYSSAYGSTTLAALSAGTIGVYLALLAWYLLLPNFAGEVEPIVASVSWWAHEGAALYHGLEDPSRYSILYGPLAFLTHGFVMGLLGPSIFSAKLSGVLAGALSLLFMGLALRQRVDRRSALGLMALGVLLCFIHGPFAFQSRPDSFLLFGASFLILAAVAAPRPLALIALAASVAWMTGFKLHGAAYLVVPAAWMARSHGVRPVLAASSLGFLLSLLPFLLSNVSLTNYVLWLREASRHGYDFATFWRTLRFGLFMLLPALILAAPIDGFRRHSRLLLLALVASLAMVLVFASKPGAGLNHLLPLVPSILLVCTEATAARARSARPRLDGMRRSALIATAMTTLFIGGVVEAKCAQKLHARARNGREVTQDLQDIIRNNPGRSIGMAYGGEGSAYDLTFYRPQLIFAGNPLLVDVIAVMEGQESRRPLPAATYESMRDGKIQIWLVPKGGQPFAKRNWYPPHAQVFPADFVAILGERYVRRAETRFFELWYHRDDVAQHGVRFEAGPRS